MAAGRQRSTRKLRSWMVEQVSSGKYPGLVWDDDAKTMFRIPWKHAGKQDFRTDEDAAIFKAWAEFKGKLKDGPASWKTRLRCALNKSAEFAEVTERAQLDISEPYKVYRLVPVSEQELVVPEKKYKEKVVRKQKRRSSDSDDEGAVQGKQIKEEVLVSSQLCLDNIALVNGAAVHTEDDQQIITMQAEGIDEIQLDVRIQTVPPPPGPAVQDSFHVVVQYLAQEVLRRKIEGSDMRITYSSSSVAPPTPASLVSRFTRVPLPELPSALNSTPEQQQALATLLPYMERGVLLTTTPGGVYGKRFCRGRVFWTGPHTATPGLHKMERNTEPVLLFSKDVFRQQLENYMMHGGECPQCGITLCFGEELSDMEDPSSKLIIAQISFPWAEQQVQSAPCALENFLQSLASQAQNGEITLNLVPVPSPAS